MSGWSGGAWKSASPSTSGWLPYLLVAPQIVITLVFFFWPSGQAIWQSLLVEDAFGGNTQVRLVRQFRAPLQRSGLLRLGAAHRGVQRRWSPSIGLALSLLLAVMADRVIRGATAYKTLLVWPYAVAPAVAGVLWGFLFNPSVGIVAWMLQGIGIDFNYVQQRQPGAAAGGDRRGLEPDQLQFPVLPRRPAVDPEVADRGRGDRRRRARPALLGHRLPAALADRLLPAGDQHPLRLLRHLRRDRRRSPRAGRARPPTSWSTRSTTTASAARTSAARRRSR